MHTKAVQLKRLRRRLAETKSQCEELDADDDDDVDDDEEEEREGG